MLEHYVDSLRCTLGRLEQSRDSNDPWISEFKRNLLERIAEVVVVDEVSVAKSDCSRILAEPMRISKRRGATQSYRESVLLSGTLAKSGILANCIVRATRVTLARVQDGEFVDADVALAPPHLPDGQYELHFEGRRMHVRNNAGRWLTSAASEHSAATVKV